LEEEDARKENQTRKALEGKRETPWKLLDSEGKKLGGRVTDMRTG
jgi:hypothetical protein